jgi:hypothetical protein
MKPLTERHREKEVRGRDGERYYIHQRNNEGNFYGSENSQAGPPVLLVKVRWRQASRWKVNYVK